MENREKCKRADLNEDGTESNEKDEDESREHDGGLGLK